MQVRKGRRGNITLVGLDKREREACHCGGGKEVMFAAIIQWTTISYS